MGCKLSLISEWTTAFHASVTAESFLFVLFDFPKLHYSGAVMCRALDYVADDVVQF